MSFSDNPARWVMILLALVLAVMVGGLSYLLDRIQGAVDKQKSSSHKAVAATPVPTDMQRLQPGAWQGARRFQRPASDEEAFSLGPFVKENLGGATEAGLPLPSTSENPAVAPLILSGTQALHAFDEERAERCFRTAAMEDPQCAGAWLGLAISSERLPGRASYFLDKAEAATQKSPVEQAWITAYRSSFAAASGEDLSGRLSRLADALEAIAKSGSEGSVATLFALRYRILAHHLTEAPLADPAAMDALLNSLVTQVGPQPVAHYGVLLWLKLDACRALPYAEKLPVSHGVTLRLAVAPREALGEWDDAINYLSFSLPLAMTSAPDLENARLLAWALFHQGKLDAAIDLATELSRLPRYPHLATGSVPDVDLGDAFLESRRLRNQLLMAAGRWEEISRSDSLTTLDEGGCQLAVAQTHYWRSIAYAANGFDKNARNQHEELQKVTGRVSEDPALSRHLASLESATRGADAFIELTRNHMTAYTGEIVDMPATALAPFFVRAGKPDVAMKLLEAELRSNPTSVPVTSMLEAVKAGKAPESKFLTGPEATAPVFNLPVPPPAPGFTLPDETGAIVGMEKWNGQPLLVIFQAGGSKVEDAEPLKRLRTHVPSFSRFGIPIVIISTEEATLLQEALGLTGTPVQERPFLMLTDKQQTAFKGWECYDNFLEKPLHGAFLVDTQGTVLWSSRSHQTCVHPEYLLMECQRLLALWKEEPAPAADPPPTSEPPSPGALDAPESTAPPAATKQAE